MNKKIMMAVAGVALLAVPAGFVLAQGGPDGRGPMMEHRGMGGPGGDGSGKEGPRGWHRSPPSPAMMERMIDGRLAGIRTALKLTPDQEKLWPALETVVRENMAERIAAREKMRADGRPMRDGDILKGLDVMSERMAVRATQMKKVAEALRPLYATFSDEQKDVLRYEMRSLMGRGGMHHGMHHGMRHGGGWQRG